MPMPRYGQIMKAIVSFTVLGAVQLPIAMRQLFKIRRNPAAGSPMTWYLFVGANIPVTLYFFARARTEMKENRKMETEYVEMMQRTGQTEMSGFEAAMIAMEGDPRKRRMVYTGVPADKPNR